MREPTFLPRHYTDFMYSWALHVSGEALCPLDPSPALLADFLADDHSQADVYSRIGAPQKRTLLDSFIENTMRCSYENVVYDFPNEERGQFTSLLSHVELPVPGWLDDEDEDLYPHREKLYDLCSQAISIISPSVFHLLFSDRSFLFGFQNQVAGYVKTLRYLEHPGILEADGVVRRTHYPGWLRRAIYFRDRGRCQICFDDLDRLRSPNMTIHLDHMVPLTAGGTNDPTNFQLTCGHCNTSKGKKVRVEMPRFEPYWLP